MKTRFELEKTLLLKTLVVAYIVALCAFFNALSEQAPFLQVKSQIRDRDILVSVYQHCLHGENQSRHNDCLIITKSIAPLLSIPQQFTANVLADIAKNAELM